MGLTRCYKTEVFLHLVDHFGDESVQAMDCNGTDNHLTCNNQENNAHIAALKTKA